MFFIFLNLKFIWYILTKHFWYFIHSHPTKVMIKFISSYITFKNKRQQILRIILVINHFKSYMNFWIIRKFISSFISFNCFLIKSFKKQIFIIFNDTNLRIFIDYWFNTINLIYFDTNKKVKSINIRIRIFFLIIFKSDISINKKENNIFSTNFISY